ncbi:MAG: dockerin type I repeat-containing protein [Ruminococcus sp.]|nr:dockerin type I repeat-containing protein [Ruminococcus sp.]
MTYNGGYVRNCYHNGTVTATNKNVGGIIGGLRVGNYDFSVNAEVYNSYHTGGTVEATNGAVGGICGYLEYGEKNKDCKIILENNYYLSSTCSGGVNGNNTSGCSKLDAKFMKNVNELLGSPFVYNDSDAINNGYPVFEWQSVPYQFRGSGTSDDPYQISSKEELEKMRDLVNSKFFTEQYSDKCYIQTADIDLENEPWTPIGTRMINNIDQSAPLFWGSYNGNGYVIKNLYLNETGGNGYTGLFGSHRGDGIIENLIVYGEVKSNSRCVGGIAGEVVNGGGIIRNCEFIGDIAGNNNNVGGIAGVLYQNGTIDNCYHIGNVSSLTTESKNFGGIVGQLIVGEGEINNVNIHKVVVRNCYNIGEIIGTSNGIGSIVGDMSHYKRVDGEIYVDNCYAIKGDVSGNISGNYTDNYDVTELSENMMRNAYDNLGDAFVKNPDIDFNNGYPVFMWQIKTNGDVNDDGKFSVADVVLLQRWLISDGNVILKNWKNADLHEDNTLDVFDLVLMKKQLIG